MATIVLKTNVSQATDVLIRDLGILVPNSGGSVTFTDIGNISDLKGSRNLRTLTTDDVFGAGSSTLIINDGTNDVAQAQVSMFMTSVETIEVLFLAIGGSLNSAGTLPVTGLGSELSLVNKEFTQIRGRRGVVGDSGTTTIQLENDGIAVGGATLSWTSSDIAFALKTNTISTVAVPGTRLSLRLTAVEGGDPQDIYVEVN